MLHCHQTRSESDIKALTWKHETMLKCFFMSVASTSSMQEARRMLSSCFDNGVEKLRLGSEIASLYAALT